MPTPLVDLVRAKVGAGFERAVGAKAEFQGPCPRCACQSKSPGHVCDRLSVFPDQPPSGDIAIKAGVAGGYWCRNCGLAGDYVQWLYDVEGWDWTKIFDYLGVERGERPARPKVLSPRPVHRSAQTGRSLDELVPVEFPNEQWREHAEKFARSCALELEKNHHLVQWLAQRGIPLSIAKSAGLGWHAGKPQKNNRSSCSYRHREAWGLPKKEWQGGRPKLFWIPRGLTIPKYRDGKLLSLRIRRPAEDLVQTDPNRETPKKYHLVEGSRHGCMIIPDCRVYVVVESELDKLTIDAAGLDGVGGCAMGSLSAYPDKAAAAMLGSALSILQALDFEPCGKGEKYGNKFRAWWLDSFSKCKRTPLPVGKDPGELVQQIGPKALRAWLQSQLPPAMRVAVPSPHGRIQRAPTMVQEPRLPAPLERLRVLFSTNRQMELYVSQPSGQLFGADVPEALSLEIGDLCFRPVVREWFSQISEPVITAENFMKPWTMEDSAQPLAQRPEGQHKKRDVWSIPMREEATYYDNR